MAGLSKPEVLANLKLILLGGMQEPGHALGICLWALLSHPDALAEVRADARCWAAPSRRRCAGTRRWAR